MFIGAVFFFLSIFKRGYKQVSERNDNNNQSNFKPEITLADNISSFNICPAPSAAFIYLLFKGFWHFQSLNLIIYITSVQLI